MIALLVIYAPCRSGEEPDNDWAALIEIAPADDCSLLPLRVRSQGMAQRRRAHCKSIITSNRFMMSLSAMVAIFQNRKLRAICRKRQLTGRLACHELPAAWRCTEQCCRPGSLEAAAKGAIASRLWVCGAAEAPASSCLASLFVKNWPPNRWERRRPRALGSVQEREPFLGACERAAKSFSRQLPAAQPKGAPLFAPHLRRFATITRRNCHGGGGGGGRASTREQSQRRAIGIGWLAGARAFIRSRW